MRFWGCKITSWEMLRICCLSERLNSSECQTCGWSAQNGEPTYGREWLAEHEKSQTGQRGGIADRPVLGASRERMTSARSRSSVVHSGTMGGSEVCLNSLGKSMCFGSSYTVSSTVHKSLTNLR